MGKFKYAIFSIIFCLCVMPIFAACGETGVHLNSISSEKVTYSVIQGGQVKLEITFSPKEATNKKLSYKIADGDEYISVDDNGVIKAKVVDDKSEHEAKVVVIPDYNSNMKIVCRVKILGEKIKLNAPTGLTYSVKDRAVVWDKVSYINSSEEDGVEFLNYNPLYTLRLASGEDANIENALEYQMDRSLKFPLTQAGTYSAWIKSTSDEMNTFSDSDYSDRFVFTILDAPSEILVQNNEIKTEVASIDDFDITMNDYELKIVDHDELLERFTKTLRMESEKQYVCWSIPSGENILDAGEYEFQIKLKGNNERYFDSNYSEKQTLIQLDKLTSLSLVGDVAQWDANSLASSYTLSIDASGLVQKVSLAGKNVYGYNDDGTVASTSEPVEFINFETHKGYYYNYNDSSGSGRYVRIDEGTYDVETGMLTLAADYNLTEHFDIEDCEGVSYTLTENITKYAAYTIKVRANGNGANILDGAFEEVELVKLGAIVDLTARTDGVYVRLEWEKVTLADSYLIFLNDKLFTETTANHYSFNENYSITDNDITFEEGFNEIYVISTSRNTYYKNSEPSNILMFEKLENPTLLTSNGDVSWEQIPNASGYDVVIKTKNGDEEEEILKQVFVNSETTTYSLSESLSGSVYADGQYYISVRAKGDNLFVRDAEEPETVCFTKQGAPRNLSLDKNGVLSWEAGANTLPYGSYEVTVHKYSDISNTNDIVFPVSGSAQSVSILNYLDRDGFGEYTCYIRAVNNSAESKYLNSDKSETAWFYRFVAPSNLRISNGGFAWDAITTGISQMDSLVAGKFIYSLQIGNGEEIDVNGCEYSPEEDECNSGLNVARLRVKTNSEQNSVSYGGNTIFLLSSNLSADFNFNKLSTPATPRIVNGQIVGECVGSISDYVLIVSLQENNSVVEEPLEILISGVKNSWSKSINELIPEGSQSGMYGIRIKALGGNQFINSNLTIDEFKLYKLDTPENLKIDNQNHRVSWDFVAKNGLFVSEYAVKYRRIFSVNSYGAWTTETVSSNFWNATNLSAGRYQVFVQATAGNFESYEILPSDFQDNSDALEVVKLKKVEYSSIKVLNNSPYNTIKWDQITDEYGNSYASEEISYIVSISKRLITGNEFIQNEIVQTNRLKFPDYCDGENYSITIQAIKNDAMPSDIPSQEFSINRLKMPTNLNISTEEYVFSWNPVSYTYNNVEKSAKYIVKYDVATLMGETLSYAEEFDVNNVGLLNNPTIVAGKYDVRVMAQIAGSDLNPQDGVLTISSAATSKYVFTKLQAPEIFVRNGEIGWYNNNSANYGYNLCFETMANVKTDIPISSSLMFYDMSNEIFVANTQYFVYITALGSYDSQHINGIYVQSDSKKLDNPVKKLVAPQFYVDNGVVKWNSIDNAKEYEITIISNNDEQKQKTSFCTMPSDLIAGKTNEINFTIKTYADAPAIDELSGNTLCYINSNSSEIFSVNKWAKPTGIVVENGEIDWTRIAEEDERGQSGEIKFGGYYVKYGNAGQTLNRTGKFVLSEMFGMDSKQTLNVSVCSMGASSGNYGGIWINSDYSDEITVTIIGAPTMFIEDGYLKWAENSNDTTRYHDYELFVLLGDDTIRTIELSETESNANRTLLMMDELYDVEEIKSVKIRHKGTQHSSGISGVYFVNSRYSNVVNNLIKRPQVNAMRVNDDGDLQWIQNSEIINYATILFDGIEVEKDSSNYIHNINGVSVLDLSYIRNTDLESPYQNIVVEYWTNGTYNLKNVAELEDNEQKFLRSESATIDITRFKQVDDFRVSSDGLKIEWDYNLTSFGDKSPDKFIISYDFASKDNYNIFVPKQAIEIVVDSDMITSNFSNYLKTVSIPLWDLGNYRFWIQTSSTSANVIKSSKKAMTYTGGDEFIKFDKFYGGNGSISNPFIIQSVTRDGFYSEDISATEQFNFIKVLSDKYFILNENIDLSENVCSANPTSSFMFENYNPILEFTGGINGNGKTIKNYRVFDGEQAYSAALFDYVIGEEDYGALSNSFYNRKGIIKDLTLEVDSFAYSGNYDCISFLCDNSLGGWFVNCKLKMTENLTSQISLSGKTIYTNASKANGISFNLVDNPLNYYYAYNNKFIKITSSNYANGILTINGINLNIPNGDVSYGGMVGLLKTSIGVAQDIVSLNDETTIYESQSMDSGHKLKFISNPIGYYYLYSGRFIEITETNYGVNNNGAYIKIDLELNNSYLDRNACLINCSSDLDVSLFVSNSNASGKTYAGGLVYKNYGGKFVNCLNSGDLAAVKIGGICYESRSSVAYEFNGVSWGSQKLVSTVFSGCENQGDLTSYALNHSVTDQSYSGGILALTNSAYVVNCLNSGNMHSITQDIQATSCVGGIVGYNEDSGAIRLINSLFLGEFTKEDNITANFYGILAYKGGTLRAQYCYYRDCYDNSDFDVNAFESGINLYCAVTETGLKDVTFLNFGSISGTDYITLNPTFTYEYNGNPEALATTLLFNSSIKQINLFYKDGTNYPILKTYIILDS